MSRLSNEELWSRFVDGLKQQEGVSFEDLYPDSDWKTIVADMAKLSSVDQGRLLKLIHDRVSSRTAASAGGWLPDLTREGVESNPGPCKHESGSASAPTSCDCVATPDDLRKENISILSGTCPICKHPASDHRDGASSGEWSRVSIQRVLDAVQKLPASRSTPSSCISLDQQIAALSISAADSNPPTSAADDLSTDSQTKRRSRPSVLRHQADLPSEIHSKAFGSYLKYVNRQPQCTKLLHVLQQTYDSYKEQQKKPDDDYVKSIEVPYSAGAPGIGKTTWARLALDHVQLPEGASKEFSDAFQQCREYGLRYRISYAEYGHFHYSEMRQPALSLAARWLWEHIKYRYSRYSLEDLWSILSDNKWYFLFQDVLKYVCTDVGLDGHDANVLCIINLDEVNALFHTTQDDIISRKFLALCLKPLLQLQRNGQGCVVPVLTATKALELPRIVSESGARYASIPLPLLTQNYVHELALDLHRRACMACNSESTSTVSATPATDVPPALRHLLVLMSGNPRFIEVLLFRLGRPDGVRNYWQPRKFVQSWHDVEEAVASVSFDKWLAPVLDEANSRYAHFREYLEDKVCNEIFPNLLYFTLFDIPVHRAKVIGHSGIQISELEENGVIFVTPITASTSTSSSSSQALVHIVLPFLWLHGIASSFHADVTNFPSLPMLTNFASCLTPDGFESLAVNTLALRCYYFAKHGNRDSNGRVFVASKDLLGVSSINGASAMIQLPPSDSTCWSVFKLRHQVNAKTFGTFSKNPKTMLTDDQLETIPSNTDPYFFENAVKSPFWDGCVLTDPPIFVQCKRSQLSLEEEARGNPPSNLSWATVWSEAKKCKVDKILPIFLVCADQVIDGPPKPVTDASSKLRLKDTDAEIAIKSRTYYVDATNQQSFFGSLLSTRKAMSFTPSM